MTYENSGNHPAPKGAWTERTFQIGALAALLGILLIELSNAVSGGGLGVRLLALMLALAAGVTLGIWCSRRPEASGKRRGSFALTCGILGTLGSAAAFVIGQIIQAALRIPAAGTFVILAIALGMFGLISLVTGIIKRVNS
jgi:hypothetical protein